MVPSRLSDHLHINLELLSNLVDRQPCLQQHWNGAREHQLLSRLYSLLYPFLPAFLYPFLSAFCDRLGFPAFVDRRKIVNQFLLGFGQFFLASLHDQLELGEVLECDLAKMRSTEVRAF